VKKYPWINGISSSAILLLSSSTKLFNSISYPCLLPRLLLLLPMSAKKKPSFTFQYFSFHLQQTFTVAVSWCMGPAPQNSVHNKRFYLDDFSKYTWLYPLETKSEVCATFLRFKQLVETYFTTKIVSVQSDNEGEFSPLKTSLTSMGISYRLSCPHTHHQMGTVERKHKHIVETGLSLLAIASIPLTF
jgi:hypothetical protein